MELLHRAMSPGTDWQELEKAGFNSGERKRELTPTACDCSIWVGSVLTILSAASPKDQLMVPSLYMEPCYGIFAD